MGIVTRTVYKIDNVFYEDGCTRTFPCGKSIVLSSDYLLELPGPDPECDEVVTKVHVEVVQYNKQIFYVGFGEGGIGINAECSANEDDDGGANPPEDLDEEVPISGVVADGDGSFVLPERFQGWLIQFSRTGLLQTQNGTLNKYGYDILTRTIDLLGNNAATGETFQVHAYKKPIL